MTAIQPSSSARIVRFVLVMIALHNWWTVMTLIISRMTKRCSGVKHLRFCRSRSSLNVCEMHIQVCQIWFMFSRRLADLPWFPPAQTMSHRPLQVCVHSIWFLSMLFEQKFRICSTRDCVQTPAFELELAQSDTSSVTALSLALVRPIDEPFTAAHQLHMEMSLGRHHN